ncbi:MAG: hypothetical protein Q9165_008829 [Trypethelium subeluteriae]
MAMRRQQESFRHKRQHPSLQRPQRPGQEKTRFALNREHRKHQLVDRPYHVNLPYVHEPLLQQDAVIVQRYRSVLPKLEFLVLGNLSLLEQTVEVLPLSVDMEGQYQSCQWARTAEEVTLEGKIKTEQACEVDEFEYGPAEIWSQTPNATVLPHRTRNRSATRGPSPHVAHSRDASRRSSAAFPNDFSFPPKIPINKTPSPDPALSPQPSAVSRADAPQFRRPSPRPPEGSQGAQSNNIPPVSRILSGTSMNGTPRTSTEIYSMSNHSDETLASDYPSRPAHGRSFSRPMNIRRISHFTPTNHQRLPETIMMGYVQIMGSFTVDGALVNQAPFEEVKRKGVVGGQGGGGVVGVERAKKDNGLFGSFGWGNIGESLGGLLGGGEMSSIKEMRGIANMKAIPLLSTPQSILFVDLSLAPGESKSYSYSFTLPRGLPPSFKGRAMKVSYHLAIGTQRAATGSQKQQVKQVEVPFRVFGGVNSRGEILGHDLMSPYIILRDQARTQSIASPSLLNGTSSSTVLKSPSASSRDSSLDDFHTYVNSLLTKPRTPSSTGLLSPTHTLTPRRSSTFSQSERLTAKEAIDFAILRSHTASTSATTTASTSPTPQSRTRFDISRNGLRVGIITLARAAYRTGETVTLTLDFAPSSSSSSSSASASNSASTSATTIAIPTYAVAVQLESAEKVDPAIALRSASSIARVTRRVHAQASASALYARRVAFQLTVPLGATPEFVTSGVSLEWGVKVEFVVPRQGAGGGGSASGVEEMAGGGGEELLEEVGRDERGRVLGAVERLPCESFEVMVPIRVYGAVAAGSEGERTEDLLV